MTIIDWRRIRKILKNITVCMCTKHPTPDDIEEILQRRDIAIPCVAHDTDKNDAVKETTSNDTTNTRAV